MNFVEIESNLLPLQGEQFSDATAGLDRGSHQRLKMRARGSE